MTEASARERERSANGWFGAPQEGQVPARAAPGGGAAATGGAELSAGSRWLRRIARVLRDALLAVAIMAMVPIGLVSITQGYIWGMNFGNTRARLAQVEPTRAFAPLRNAAVTPMQAGLALAALAPSDAFGTFIPLRSVRERAVRPWSDAKLAAGMFASAPVNQIWYGPHSQSILEAAAQGLSARELAYLKTVATAPLWARYDLIARAPAVDILGGRFQLPYPDDALLYNVPVMKFAATKELAHAGVSRAAYYLAIGQRAEAEAALRSIIGFGFALIDNGTFAMDGLIGRVIVGIGRDALGRFYTLTGDPRAAALVALAPPPEGSGRASQPSSNRPTVEFMRERLLQAAQNPALPRTLRYESLYQLSLSSCTNARELVFGMGSDVRQAYESAARDLARYPSERAILDLALQTIDRVPANPMWNDMPKGDVVVRLLVGASTVAGVVLDNPRMPFCTRAVTSGVFR